jgi:tight adherence protein B
MIMARGGAESGRRPQLFEALDLRLARSERGQLLGAKLRSAGTDFTAAQFLVLVVAIAVAAYLIAWLVFPPVIGVVLAALAVWAAFAWLGRKLDKRKEQFIAQLPEVARLLSNSASAGLSMPAAIELTVREVDSPAKDELQTIVDELHFGRSLDDSLSSLSARLPSREISVLMATLVIQQRAGGDVVRALQDLSDTLDGRRETMREVRTLMAGAVFTSYVVPVIGIGALLLLNSINSKTLHRMTTSPVGIAVLVIAGLMYAIGSFAIRRTSRIDV